jgi:hypothetical protein
VLLDAPPEFSAAVDHASSLKESVAAALRGDYYEKKEAGGEEPSWVLLGRPFFS